MPDWDGGAVRHQCNFWRKWQLPCRHLWLVEHVVGDVFTQDYRKGTATIFDNGGFAVNEDIEEVYLTV